MQRIEMSCATYSSISWRWQVGSFCITLTSCSKQPECLEDDIRPKVLTMGNGGSDILPNLLIFFSAIHCMSIIEEMFHLLQ